MARAPEAAVLVAAILNAAWMVRHYRHGDPEKRSQAIRIMALAVRKAFDELAHEHDEEILTAVVDGLRPNDEPHI